MAGEEEPRRAERARRRGRGRRRRDLRARVLAALPAIAFAIFIVSQGGLVFALGVLVLGIAALGELYGLTKVVRPVNLAGFLAVAGLVMAALYGTPFHIVLALAAAFPLTFVLALLRPWREHVAWAIAVTLFGVAWVGLPLAHAVLLRELDHGGALVLDVLLATFLGDTAAYFAGRSVGRRPIAPWISPNKTLEGLVAGIVVATIVFWGFEVAYQDVIRGLDALLIGFCVALAAPVGDLFESLVKRDLEVKDTGGLFGAHGGALDRLDAVFFSIPVAYYVTVAVV